MAGSQEIETVQVRLAGELVTVEAETFMGLSVTGNERTIGEIAERVVQATRSAST